MKTNLNRLSKLMIMLSLMLFVVVIGCRKQAGQEPLTSYLTPQLPANTFDYRANIDEGVRFGDGVHYPERLATAGNRINSDKATLGRVIFYDKMLSANNAIACASCHKQELGFADGKQFSTGYANMVTKRNSMAIANPAIAQGSQGFGTGFFWDLRESDLTMMVTRPVQNHIEMGFDTISRVLSKMQAAGYYDKLFLNAYGSSDITVDRLRESLAEFLMSMVTVSSRYDQAAQNHFGTYNPQELRGWQIFSKEGNCIRCHGGDLNNDWVETVANIGLDEHYTDQGSKIRSGGFFLTGGKTLGEPEGLFKVPSLRNVELTAPYMHDGRFKTLDEVVEHYSSGVKDHPDLNWNLRVFNADGTSSPKHLNLTDSDKKALIAFLKTLTDKKFITDVRFSNPFVAKALN